ncbi:MAG: N-acetylmuramoyl-L-alanine amidase [Spirochaetes bacterium]|nr:N-acetylmuramoyl-L-alanine amidase [Spirochaetota bacterium]
MIIVHYTATRTIQETLLIFKPDELKNTRPDIADGGTLNVGVHFLIDKDGSIWSLLPVSIIGRHTIGYNHISLGIELVGMSGQSLTDQQLESCSSLVAGLCSQFRTIEYLIGHHEYIKKNLPHFLLFKELDSSYHPAVKFDPGDNFMRMLRTQLKTKYNLKLMK